MLSNVFPMGRVWVVCEAYPRARVLINLSGHYGAVARNDV